MDGSTKQNIAAVVVRLTGELRSKSRVEVEYWRYSNVPTADS